MGKRLDEVCLGRCRVTAIKVIAAAAEDERELRESLAKCRTSNAALAQQVRDLADLIRIEQDENARLRGCLQELETCARRYLREEGDGHQWHGWSLDELTAAIADAEELTDGGVGNPTGDTECQVGLRCSRHAEEVPRLGLDKNTEDALDARDGGKPARLHSRPSGGVAPVAASGEGDARTDVDGVDSASDGREIGAPRD